MGRRGGLDSLSLDRAGKFGAKSEEMDGTPNFKLLIAIYIKSNYIIKKVKKLLK